MWDNLVNNYEGNEKVKDAKLQTYKLKFEQLNMNEEEIVSKYFSKNRRDCEFHEGSW